MSSATAINLSDRQFARFRQLIDDIVGISLCEAKNPLVAGRLSKRLRELFDEQGQRRRRENLVLVSYAGKRAGLVLDRLPGELQRVIKLLGKRFANCRGIAGFSILGSGAVALILDTPNLLSTLSPPAANPVKALASEA